MRRLAVVAVCLLGAAARADVSLDAAAAATAGDLSPSAMAGPFPSVARACRALGLEGYQDRGEEKVALRCSARPLVARQKVLLEPIKTIAVIKRDVDDMHDSAMYHLAIQTDRGWFIGHRPAFTTTSGRCWGELTVEELAMRALTDGELPRAVWRYRLKGSCSGGSERSEYENDWNDHYWVVGGIGESVTPSSTPPIAVTQRHRLRRTSYDEGHDTERKTHSTRLALRFAPGELILDGKLDQFDDSWEKPPRLGRHPLKFP
jgi:hypothetical protein